MLKNAKSSPPYSFKTLLPWFLIAIGVFLLIAALYAATHRPAKLATKEDITKLRTIVTDIKNKLEDTNGEWQDTSSCTVIKPRLFGDKEEYYCTIEYAREYNFVGSQEVMRDAINEQHQKVAKHPQVGGIRLPSHPSYIETEAGEISVIDQFGSYAFFIKNMPSARCAVNNEAKISKGNLIFKQDIGCNIDTVSAFGEKIRKV